jgi:hypothetical protein
MEVLKLVSGKNTSLHDTTNEKERDLVTLRWENEILKAGEATCVVARQGVQSPATGSAVKIPLLLWRARMVCRTTPTLLPMELCPLRHSPLLLSRPRARYAAPTPPYRQAPALPPPKVGRPYRLGPWSNR